ncbi:MAG: hypothetical protein M3N21_07415, partial [Actinomycetota bacterium]|nr:hypothetical protein [Actinomycetota bacterium]
MFEMPYVVVTRMSPAGIRGGLLALRLTGKVVRQLRHQPGLCGGAVLADRSGGFWTVTVWSDGESLAAFRSAHAAVAARGPAVTGAPAGASGAAPSGGLVLTAWQQEGCGVPGWD